MIMNEHASFEGANNKAFNSSILFLVVTDNKLHFKRNHMAKMIMEGLSNTFQSYSLLNQP